MLPDRLKPKFLRKARAVPLSFDGACWSRVAVADPLDDFTLQSIAAATGRRVALEIGVPIELDAALDRLYPESAGAKDDIVDDVHERTWRAA